MEVLTFPISGTLSDVTVLTNVAIQQLVDNFEVDYDKRLIEAPDMNKYKIGGENAGTFIYILKKKNYLDDSTPNYLGTAIEVVNTSQWSSICVPVHCFRGEL